MSRRRVHILMIGAFWLLSGLLHVNALFVTHAVGDEFVYLTLAREMNWDLSHYTTRDDPEVSRYSAASYRMPLFQHPPAYPLLLKVGQAVGAPILLAMAFSMFAMGLLLYYTWRLAHLLRIPPRYALSGYAGAAMGPLLLFSTARLHMDGLLGAFLACAFVATLEAFEHWSWKSAIAAGLLWVVALNLRYNALVALPILPAAQLYFLHRRSSEGAGFWGAARDWKNWKAFAVILAFVLTLGLQHFYRVQWEYGTLLLTQFGDYDPLTTPPGELFRWRRSRLDVAAGLFLVFPGLVLFMTPWLFRTIRGDLRSKQWAPFIVLVFLYCFSSSMALLFKQLRYFAIATPFLYLSAPYLLMRSRGNRPYRLVGALGALTLFTMVSTGFHNTIRHPEYRGIEPIFTAWRDELTRDR